MLSDMIHTMLSNGKFHNHNDHICTAFRLILLKWVFQYEYVAIQYYVFNKLI